MRISAKIFRGNIDFFENSVGITDDCIIEISLDEAINARYKNPFVLSKSTPEEKRQQEINSLKRVPDSFKKIVVVKDNIVPWHDEDGIYYVGIEEFLLDENCINM